MAKGKAKAKGKGKKEEEKKEDKKPKKIPPPPKSFTQEMIQDFKAAFLEFDEAGIYKIPKVNLGICLRKMGFNPSNAQIQELMETFMDDPLSDLIEFHEFLFMIERKIAWGDDIESVVMNSFKVFDEKEEGTIEFLHLWEMLTQWGEPFTEAEFVDLPKLAKKLKAVEDQIKLKYEMFVDKVNETDQKFLPEPVNYWKMDQKQLLQFAMKKAQEEAAEFQKREADRIAKLEMKRQRMIEAGLLAEGDEFLG